MKIIVPLAGPNDDFIKSFGTIKALTKVADEFLLEKFIKSFKLNFEYIFICNLSDLLNSDLLKIINAFKIKKKILTVNSKTGNIIETILIADKHINNNESITVVHPDSEIFFDKKKFINIIKNNKISGAVFTYDHFNPTFLKSDLVGRAKIDSSNNIIEIKEKSIFNENESTLSGIYYYSKWKDFKKYSNLTFKNQNSINGIFYESQVYNEYIKDNKIIKNFNVKKFISLGLTKNVDEYNFWFKYYNKSKKTKYKLNFNQINLIPACGIGNRFASSGYKTIKPLIKVQNSTMLGATIKSLPPSKKNIILIKKEHEKDYLISKKFKKHKNIKFIYLNKDTDGMARTCMYAKKHIPNNKPVIISSCDYSIVFNENKLQLIIKTINPDVIIWTFIKYPDARINPYAYAYLEINDGFVTKISEKVPISNTPNKDNIVQGVFYFKRAEMFYKAANLMFKKKHQVNGEYYIATAINELINLKFKVVPFQVDQYICWGTPFDLKNYEFWENRFLSK